MNKALILLSKSSQSGFSLAEILICIALVGILSALTIPMMINGTQTDRTSQYTSKAKSTALMIATGYERYKAANGGVVQSSFDFSGLLPYLNYVKNDSSNTLDTTSAGSITCTGSGRGCIALHNGAEIYYNTATTFGGTNTTNAIWLGFDPDGTRNNQPSLGMVLTYGGSVITYGNLDQTYYYYTSSTNSIVSTSDPSWFSGF